MSALTNYSENLILDWWFRGRAVTPPATRYFALFVSSTPDDTGSALEVSAGGYARVAVNSSLANFAGTQGAGTTVNSSGTGGTTSNNALITFPVPSANWGTATAMATFDAATGGNMLEYSALTTPRTINNGDPAPSFAAGAFTFQIDN